MGLLNTLTLELKTFSATPPPYAILAHRWSEDEVLFGDVGKPLGTWWHKAGAAKVLQGSLTALALGYRHLWIDSCCIDKTSSAELAEAANSMYRWYRDAACCLAFLADVRAADVLLASCWFTRGWKLQELVAPRRLRFYSADWTDLGGRADWAVRIAAATSIDADLLLLPPPPEPQPAGAPEDDAARVLLRGCSTHTKMRWAARRTTTRPEDLAYCLLGLFGVSMPLVYGKGRMRAFGRLHEEILKGADADQSVLVQIRQLPGPLLTAAPAAFSVGLDVVKCARAAAHGIAIFAGGALRLDLILCPLAGRRGVDELAIGCLECFVRAGETTITRPGILLKRYLDGWCRFKWDAIYLLHPGMGNVAVAFPSCFGQHAFTAGRRQTIQLYDVDPLGPAATPSSSRQWQKRAILLGPIAQTAAGPQYCFGRTTPAEHHGLVSLSGVLCTVPGMEIRCVIWIATQGGDAVRKYCCAVICGVVGEGAPDAVRCWTVAAETMVPSWRLGGGRLDSANPDLGDLLSRRSVVHMLGRIPGPPLGAGNFVPRGIDTAQMGPQSVKAKLVELSFLETSYQTLNIEVTTARG